MREAREETGLAVETGEFLGVFDRVIRDDCGRVQCHYVRVDCLCRRLGGELQAAGDAAEARWFARDERAELMLAEKRPAAACYFLLWNNFEFRSGQYSLIRLEAPSSAT